MALTITYKITPFNLTKALQGTPVTLAAETSGTTDFDVKTQAGILTTTAVNGRYLITVNNVLYEVNAYGESMNVSPSVQFHMVESTLPTSYGTSQTMTRGVSTDESDVADLSSMEPRDQFAIHAMNAMIRNIEHPENANDATIMLYSKAAYRWAQGMMIASADARTAAKKDEGGGGGGEEETTRGVAVDITSASVSEKLLNNIVASLDKLAQQINTSMTDSKTQSTTNTTALKNAIGDVKTALTASQTQSTTDMATLKNAINEVKTALAGTLKIDNPTNDKFDVEGGGGGGSSLNRGDVNDTAQAITDFLVYNTGSGNAPMRATIANVITKVIATMTTEQKTALYTALKSLMQADFDAKGSSDSALIAAKAYTDTEIAKKHPST